MSKKEYNMLFHIRLNFSLWTIVHSVRVCFKNKSFDIEIIPFFNMHGCDLSDQNHWSTELLHGGHTVLKYIGVENPGRTVFFP